MLTAKYYSDIKECLRAVEVLLEDADPDSWVEVKKTRGENGHYFYYYIAHLMRYA